MILPICKPEREQVLSGGPVKFSLVREAAQLSAKCFQDGRGSGTFRFTEIRVLFRL